MDELYLMNPVNAKLWVKISEIMATIDNENINKYFGIKNLNNKDAFDVACETKYYDIATDILKLIAKKTPEEFLERNLPEEILKSDKFSELAENILTNKMWRKDETLKFLDKYEKYIPEGGLKKYIIDEYSI